MTEEHRKWSASRWKTLARCPRLLRAEYVDGLRAPAGAAAKAGNKLHRDLENYLDGKLERDDLPGSVQVVVDFLPTVEALRAMHWWPGPELPLSRIPGWRGFIDCTFQRTAESVPWVVDMKTMGSFRYAKTDDQLALDPQMTVYGLEVARITGRDQVRVVHAQTIRNGKELRIAQALVDRDWLESRFQELVRLTELGESLWSDHFSSFRDVAPLPGAPHKPACGAYGGCVHTLTCARDNNPGGSFLANLKGAKMAKVDTNAFLELFDSLSDADQGKVLETLGGAPSAMEAAGHEHAHHAMAFMEDAKTAPSLSTLRLLWKEVGALVKSSGNEDPRPAVADPNGDSYMAPAQRRKTHGVLTEWKERQTDVPEGPKPPDAAPESEVGVPDSEAVASMEDAKGVGNTAVDRFVKAVRLSVDSECPDNPSAAYAVAVFEACPELVGQVKGMSSAKVDAIRELVAEGDDQDEVDRFLAQLGESKPAPLQRPPVPSNAALEAMEQGGPSGVDRETGYPEPPRGPMLKALAKLESESTPSRVETKHGSGLGFALLVGCAPHLWDGEVVHLSRILEALSGAVVATFGEDVPHWRCIPYGQGPAVMASELRDRLKDFVGPDDALVANPRADSVILDVCVSLAGAVVWGTQS